MANAGEKQYGLIIPKKQPTKTPLSNIFGAGAGSDEEDGTDWVRKALKAENEKNKIKKQTKLNMQKALKEDPTIYQYDEVYDDMERTKNESKLLKQEDKRPKYIGNLLKAAERRKKEQEHRIERMVQKEREAEGDMYADKESFVTSAYRAKLEEFKKMEEEEARMSRLEAIADVTKQQDISGFYRHFFEHTVDNKPKQVTDSTGKNEKPEASSNSAETEDSNIVTDTKEDEVNQGTSSKEHSIISKSKRNRQYRQRVVEEENSDNDSKSTEKSSQPSDKPLDPMPNKNDTDAHAEEPEVKKQKQAIEDAVKSTDEVQKQEKTDADITNPASEPVKQTENNNSDSHKSEKTENENDAKQKLEEARKERSRIWEKRTVGPVFDAALERYYARKAMRLSTV